MRKIALIVIACTGILSSCGTNTPGNGNATNTNSGDTSNPGGLAPVETRSANTNYRPAFAGQTRIAGVRTTTSYGGTVVTDDLKRPWGITALSNGNFLITEKGGTLRIVTVTGAISEPITGLPAVNAAGQGGLLDIITDPQFQTNRMIYWTFSESITGGNVTAVGKGTLSADDKRVENATVIYRALPAYPNNMHFGSRILVDNAGNLLVSTGERSDIETRPQAQQLNSAFGKIVRITKDGQPASGNPFIGQANAKPEIYTYGHRNVQGMAFHPVTGDLWESEMGPRGGDELNLIQAGKNYGWPVIGYGIEYNGQKIGDAITQKAGMEQPIYYWDPVLSPSGMTFLTSDNIPEWKNNLFIAGLNSNHIARLVITNNKVVGEERLLSGEGQRFRDVTQGTDGALYAVTDEGRLYKIAKR